VVIESDNAEVITYLESVISDYLLYKNIDSGLKKIKDLLESNYPNYHNYWDRESQVWIPIPPELYAETFIAANNNFWKHPNIFILKDKNLDDIWVFKNENTYETDLGNLLIFYQKSYYDLFTTYQEDGITGILSNEELIEEADKRYYLDDYTNLWSKFIMPDTPRIKEIHAALNASAFSQIDGVNVVANLGYYIERIARVNGISVNPDGSIRSIRNSIRLEQDEVIPAGYNFGQFGEHFAGNKDKKLGQLGGKDTEKRDGIVYEVKSNMREKDNFNKTKIKAGGYILCENIPQYLHVLMQDLDKALSLQEMGAFPLPTPNNKDYVIYEGIHSLIADIAYMLSRLSETTSHTQIAGLVTQMVVFELLRGLGVPVTAKAMQIDVETETAYIHYPGLTPDAPTINQQFKWVLTNLLPIIKSVLKLDLEAFK